MHVNVPTGLLICGGLVMLAFFIAQPILPLGSLLTRDSLAIALAIVLIGLFTMIARQKAVSQLVGFLVLENGLFLGATAATYGMPLVAELGVFFDVLIATLIAGIYGMNFQKTSAFNMPELYWAFGYPFALGLMIVSIILLYFLFKKKGWL